MRDIWYISQSFVTGGSGKNHFYYHSHSSELESTVLH